MTTIYPTAAAAAAAISFLYLGRFILQNGAIRERTNERASDMSFSFFFLSRFLDRDPLVNVWKKKEVGALYTTSHCLFPPFPPLPCPPLLLLTAAAVV